MESVDLRHPETGAEMTQPAGVTPYFLARGWEVTNFAAEQAASEAAELERAAEAIAGAAAAAARRAEAEAEAAVGEHDRGDTADAVTVSGLVPPADTEFTPAFTDVPAVVSDTVVEVADFLDDEDDDLTV